MLNLSVLENWPVAAAEIRITAPAQRVRRDKRIDILQR
jgi:hypothetical protein